MIKEIDIKHQHHTLPAMNEAWCGFREEIDRIFDRFADGFESVSLQPFARMQRRWGPGVSGFANLAVDVSETDKAYTVSAELPGMKEKDIEVSVSDDMLVIKGQKEQEREEKDKSHYLSERSYGSFQRMFSLPRDTEASKIEARYQNGVLTVSVPKAAGKQETQKVEVKAA
jgi:HSP20 family protein